jgi:hypothetical protein
MSVAQIGSRSSVAAGAFSHSPFTKLRTITAGVRSVSAVLDDEPRRKKLIFDAADASGVLSQRVRTPFEQESTLKISFLLHGHIAPLWRLKQPLPMTLEEDDDGTLVMSDGVFDQFGLGDTFSEARLDYIANLIDYFLFVRSRATDDDPPTQALFAYLQEYIQAPDF